jgi:hypothetical protein
MCIFISGCTSETEDSQSLSTDVKNADQMAPSGEMPAGEMPSEMNGTKGEPGAGEMQTIDYASASATLGVTEDELTAALSASEGEMPDFDSAATTLGVTVEELMSALGMTGGAGGEMPQGGGGEPPEAMPTETST